MRSVKKRKKTSKKLVKSNPEVYYRRSTSAESLRDEVSQQARGARDQVQQHPRPRVFQAEAHEGKLAGGALTYRIEEGLRRKTSQEFSRKTQ